MILLINSNFFECRFQRWLTYSMRISNVRLDQLTISKFIFDTTTQNYLKSNKLDRILTDDYEINKNLNVQLA